MKLKDFKVGQVVYIAERTPRSADALRQYSVMSVGRKYVKAESELGNIREFEVFRDSDPYLVEHTSFGEKTLLFPDKESAMTHVEGNVLRIWLRQAVDWPKLNRYTVEQLRAVKNILDDQAGD